MWISSFEIERAEEARQALRDLTNTKARFADAFIGRINRTLAGEHTATFGRVLKSLDTFSVL